MLNKIEIQKKMAEKKWTFFQKSNLIILNNCLKYAVVAAVVHVAVSSHTLSADILPEAKWSAPAYEPLSRGGMRVRLVPGTTLPGLQEYAGASNSKNNVALSDKFGLMEFWWLGGGRGPNGGRDEWLVYLKSGKPVTVSQNIAQVYSSKAVAAPDFANKVEWFLRESKGRVNFEVGEWENAINAWWTTPEARSKVCEDQFGKGEAEISTMNRRQLYETVVAGLRKWKEAAKGRLSLVNGHGLLSHTAEIGLDSIGIETSDGISSTQVKRAFARGAARQFGIPWFEQVSVWYGNSVPCGCPCEAHEKGSWIGPDCGHSVSHLARHWYTAWFSGAAYVMPEASQCVLYDFGWQDSEFPASAGLSKYGKKAQDLAKLMRAVDRGVPYAPFGVIIDKYHGRWDWWVKPWGRFDETPGDRMVVSFFDQFFPGQSLGHGDEERFLCPSPYGDTCDVFINDADRSVWKDYPVLFALGDISWTSDDIDYLRNYVRGGGILVLSEFNIGGWDRKLLGLSDRAFVPAGAKTVIEDEQGAPVLMRKSVDRGWIYVAAADKRLSKGSSKTRAIPGAVAYPKEFLDALAERFLPVKVSGKLETLVNRTPNGWSLMLVNNNGFIKVKERLKPAVVDMSITAPPNAEEGGYFASFKPPVVDMSATENATVLFKDEPTVVRDVISGESFKCERSGSGWAVSVVVKPGDLRLLEAVMGSAR